MKGEGLGIRCICSTQSPAVRCSLGNNTLEKKKDDEKNNDQTKHADTATPLTVYTVIKMWFVLPSSLCIHMPFLSNLSYQHI